MYLKSSLHESGLYTTDGRQKGVEVPDKTLPP
jgi:hypothetical protein